MYATVLKQNPPAGYPRYLWTTCRITKRVSPGCRAGLGFAGSAAKTGRAWLLRKRNLKQVNQIPRQPL